jgi:hypothetical protein
MGALDAPRTVSVRAVGRQVNVLRLFSAAGSCNSPSSARRQFEACTKPVPIGPRHHPHIASGRRAHRRFRCVTSRVSLHRRIRRCLSILSHRDCGASATQNSLHHGTPRAAVTPLLGLARIRPHLRIKHVRSSRHICTFPRRPQRSRRESPSFTHGNTSVYAYRATGALTLKSPYDAVDMGCCGPLLRKPRFLITIAAFQHRATGPGPAAATLEPLGAR